MQRKKLRWGVIRLYIIQDELKYSQNIGDVKRHLSKLHQTMDIIDDVDDFTLDENDFRIINRFLAYKQSIGKCDIDRLHVVSHDGYIAIRNINGEKYLLSALDNFESYWENVLDSYKRKSDKKKRLQYLIENLDETLKDTTLSYDNVRKRIMTLYDKYHNELYNMS